MTSVIIIIFLHMHVCRSWLRSSIALMVVMGLTWAVGILVFDNTLLPYSLFGYVFTVFVAFQVGFSVVVGHWLAPYRLVHVLCLPVRGRERSYNSELKFGQKMARA